MSDQAVNSEKPNPIRFEVKTERDITPQDLTEFGEFVDRHANSFLVMPDKETDEAEGVWNAAFTHSIALSTLNKLKEGEPASIVFARDTSGLVGYSVVLIDPNHKHVVADFIGVDDIKTHQGIGTEILKTRLEALKKMGITSYVSSSRDYVAGLYDRLGVKYTSEPNPNNPEDVLLRVSF